jgi:SulP family sulfate permease
VRYIPVSIVVGFTNGIAVLIALSQVKELLGLQVGPVGADFFAQLQAIRQHIDRFSPYAFGLAWPRSSACCSGRGWRRCRS